MRDIEKEIAETRRELEKTLAAIEDKFNIPKRAKKLQVKTRHSIDRNPKAWLIGSVAVLAAGVGLIVLAAKKR